LIKTRYYAILIFNQMEEHRGEKQSKVISK